MDTRAETKRPGDFKSRCKIAYIDEHFLVDVFNAKTHGHFFGVPVTEDLPEGTLVVQAWPEPRNRAICVLLYNPAWPEVESGDRYPDLHPPIIDYRTFVIDRDTRPWDERLDRAEGRCRELEDRVVFLRAIADERNFLLAFVKWIADNPLQGGATDRLCGEVLKMFTVQDNWDCTPHKQEVLDQVKKGILDAMESCRDA